MACLPKLAGDTMDTITLIISIGALIVAIAALALAWKNRK